MNHLDRSDTALEKHSAITADQLAEFAKSPLRQLPPEWRVPVWDFWSFWSHLLPTQLPLATRLRQWRDAGVTLDEVIAAFRRINTAENAEKCRFPGDLLADLALHLSSAYNPGARDRERAAAREAYLKVQYSTCPPA